MRAVVPIVVLLGLASAAFGRERDTVIAKDYRRTTIYHSPQSPGYTCWCGAWTMPDRSIMVSFTQATGPASGKEKASAEVMRQLDWFPEYDMTGLDMRNVHLRSTDGGKTWANVSEDPFRSPMNGVTNDCEVALRDGTVVRGVWGHYLPYDPAAPKTGYLQRSTDSTKTWSKPQPLLDPKEYEVWPKRLRVLKDGRLIVTGGLARVPAGSKTRVGVIPYLEPLLMVSGNGGRTWSKPIPAVPEEFRSTWRCEEYDAAELPNGDLLCVYRRPEPGGERHVLWQGVLKKAGATWTPLSAGPSPLQMAGHPELIATREGVVLFLAPSGVSWTDDAGKSWHSLGLPGTGYYPRSVQCADGRILVLGHIGSDDPYGKVDQSIVMDEFRIERRGAPASH